MKKKCVIIQARTDSRRLPNKILLHIEGKSMLWHVINRIKNIYSDEIIIATTTRDMDDVIVKIGEDFGVKIFRGKTDDVLDRFYQAAKKYAVDVIIRITADCPLIDANESNKVLKEFMKGDYDYISNDSETYPNGLDTECFSFKALEDSWNESRLKSDREHVTSYIWKNPKKFRISVVNNNSKSKLDDMKWSVDNKEDFNFVKTIYSKLYDYDNDFTMNDVLKLLAKEPKLKNINSNFIKNEGYLYSLKND
tara:strand:- start:3821 stop:4573 length:753 start_codon:yes stop_codon:yes gene_type:complete